MMCRNSTRESAKPDGGSDWWAERWIDAYGLLALSKLRFYAPPMRKILGGNHPWSELPARSGARPPLASAKSWDLGCCAGHPGWALVASKGDRVAMHSSVEVRYPFLDEDVFDFLAKLHPRWKLRGFRDKHLLRLLAERWLPPSVYRRSKVIFRAPLDSFHIDPSHSWSTARASLKRTGYFDVSAVRHWRQLFGRCARFAAPHVCGNGPGGGGRASSGITSLSMAILRICRPGRGFPPLGRSRGNNRAITEASPACPDPALRLRIIFFGAWHRETFLDKSARFFSLPHLSVGSPQLNVVHQATGIDLQGFLKTAYGFLSCCFWQLSV